MNGFEKRRAEKKKVIEEAALRLFLAAGLENVTVKQIADEARVSHVSIYNFYGGKSQLIHEMAAAIISGIRQEYDRIFNEEQSFDEKLGRIMGLKMDLIKTRNWEFVVEATRSSSSLKNAFEEMITTSKTCFLSVLDEGKNAGFIRTNVGNDAILTLIDILTAYFYENEWARAALSYQDGLLSDLQYILWHGILNPGSPAGLD